MHEANLLKDVATAVLGAAAVALPFYLLRLPLLLGYLAAGVLLGPHLGFGVIQSAGSIATLSEIGLILLMFILGLEIDLRKLMQSGKTVLVNGAVQFICCALLAFGLFSLLGYRNEGGFELTYLAVACALSSTLIVVKLLSDQMELDTLTSRITLGILVLQDLWAIAFLAVQPNLNDLQLSALARSAGNALLLLVTSFVMARFILPPLFRRSAKQPELLLVLAMAWCFFMCGLAEHLQLSLEMGALMAGIGIASFPYHVDIASKVSALRDFFVTLFFVALGLQIPVPTGAVLLLTAAIVGFCLLSRLLTVFPVLYFMRYGNRASLVPALNLSQISEFSLVLAALGVSLGHIRPELLSAFVLALVATALLSALIIPHTHGLCRALNPLLESVGFRDRLLCTREQSASAEHPSVVLLGFYREGSSLLQEILARHSAKLLPQILVVDFNPEAHRKLSESGVRCVYGDLSHIDTLRHLHLAQAQVLICTIPDHLLKGTSNLELLQALKSLAPQAQIIVTAETLESARDMYRQGAAYVFTPRLVAAAYLADLLDHIHAGTDAAFKQASQQRLEGCAEVLP